MWMHAPQQFIGIREDAVGIVVNRKGNKGQHSTVEHKGSISFHQLLPFSKLNVLLGEVNHKGITTIKEEDRKVTKSYSLTLDNNLYLFTVYVVSKYIVQCITYVHWPDCF